MKTDIHLLNVQEVQYTTIRQLWHFSSDNSCLEHLEYLHPSEVKLELACITQFRVLLSLIIYFAHKVLCMLLKHCCRFHVGNIGELVPGVSVFFLVDGHR